MINSHFLSCESSGHAGVYIFKNYFPWVMNFEDFFFGGGGLIEHLNASFFLILLVLLPKFPE